MIHIGSLCAALAPILLGETATSFHISFMMSYEKTTVAFTFISVADRRMRMRVRRNSFLPCDTFFFFLRPRGECEEVR